MLQTTPKAATPTVPVSERIRKLKTSIVTPDAMSPTNAEVPSCEACRIMRHDGFQFFIRIEHFFVNICVPQTAQLTIGEIPVARAAPAMPSFIGNMKI